MDWSLEVVVLPVSDIERAVAFYRDQVGFHLDHDTQNEHMHVVQLTPPGSGCSIVFGDLPSQTEMAPGSMKGLQLVVDGTEPEVILQVLENEIDGASGRAATDRAVFEKAGGFAPTMGILGTVLGLVIGYAPVIGLAVAEQRGRGLVAFAGP